MNIFILLFLAILIAGYFILNKEKIKEGMERLEVSAKNYESTGSATTGSTIAGSEAIPGSVPFQEQDGLRLNSLRSGRNFESEFDTLRKELKTRIENENKKQKTQLEKKNEWDAIAANDMRGKSIETPLYKWSKFDGYISSNGANVSKATEIGWFSPDETLFDAAQDTAAQINLIKNWLKEENVKMGYTYYICFSFHKAYPTKPQVFKRTNGPDGNISAVSANKASHDDWDTYYISNLFDISKKNKKNQPQLKGKSIYDIRMPSEKETELEFQLLMDDLDFEVEIQKQNEDIFNDELGISAIRLKNEKMQEILNIRQRTREKVMDYKKTFQILDKNIKIYRMMKWAAAKNVENMIKKAVGKGASVPWKLTSIISELNKTGDADEKELYQWVQSSDYTGETNNPILKRERVKRFTIYNENTLLNFGTQGTNFKNMFDLNMNYLNKHFENKETSMATYFTQIQTNLETRIINRIENSEKNIDSTALGAQCSEDNGNCLATYLEKIVYIPEEEKKKRAKGIDECIKNDKGYCPTKKSYTHIFNKANQMLAADIIEFKMLPAKKKEYKMNEKDGFDVMQNNQFSILKHKFSSIYRKIFKLSEGLIMKGEQKNPTTNTNDGDDKNWKWITYESPDYVIVPPAEKKVSDIFENINILVINNPSEAFQQVATATTEAAETAEAKAEADEVTKATFIKKLDLTKEGTPAINLWILKIYTHAAGYSFLTLWQSPLSDPDIDQANQWGEYLKKLYDAPNFENILKDDKFYLIENTEYTGESGRYIFVMKRGFFLQEPNNNSDAKDHEKFGTTVMGEGNASGWVCNASDGKCKNKKYDKQCSLYWKKDHKEDYPRCLNNNNEFIVDNLKDYLKDCPTGMKTFGENKCVSDRVTIGQKKKVSEHLRDCYLWKDGLSKKCDPKKKKEGDCLCQYYHKPITGGGQNKIKMEGIPIVEDSFCKANQSEDLTYEQCNRYSKWKRKDKHKILNADGNKYFNYDDNKNGGSYRMGCQERTGIDGGQDDRFAYVNPTDVYGKMTTERKYSPFYAANKITANIDIKTELDTLKKWTDVWEPVCKNHYDLMNVVEIAKDIEKADEDPTIDHVKIPGMKNKNDTGAFLITEPSKFQRNMATVNCNSNNSWDACFMAGTAQMIDKGEKLVKNKGYTKFQQKNAYQKPVEGFVGNIKEGAGEDGVSDSIPCRMKNCVPVRFSNSNCGQDITVTKGVDNIQRFFKMCPQECLGPIMVDGKLDPRYQDIDRSGEMNDDGTRVKYDEDIHGCKTSAQCNVCNKSEVQVKDVYDNQCTDLSENDCTRVLLEKQYKTGFDKNKDGEIKDNDTIQLKTFNLDNKFLKVYLPSTPAKNKSRSYKFAILKFIEMLKKESSQYVIGISYPSMLDIPNGTLTNATRKFHVIFKKNNIEPNLQYKRKDPENLWTTKIHNRRWEDYWVDPSKNSIKALERDLTQNEMDRMQGINLGISQKAFAKIPTFWEMDKTKKANAGQICDWIKDKIKAGVLTDKDSCTPVFNSSWTSRTMGTLAKSPTEGINFEEFEQIYNLKENAEEGTPYTDMTNSLDIGVKDMSLDDYYKRRLLSSKVENRLGGSENAYTKTYKPLNPNASPKFFNSAWGLFH